VMEYRPPGDSGDLVVAGRQRIVDAAGRDGREKDDRAVRAQHAQRGIRASDLNDKPCVRCVGGGLRARVERCHRRYTDLLTRRERGAGGQTLQQRGRRVEPFGEHFDRRLVFEPGQLRLLDEIFRDVRDEGTCHVLTGDGIRGDWRTRRITAERPPRLAVGGAVAGKPLRGLERGERVREVVARLAVYLSRRESLSIEQNLEPEVVAAR